MATLGERLRMLRKEKGLTQEELGRIIGVEKSTISYYESNRSTPNDEIKAKLADFFGVSLDYLLGRTDIREGERIGDLEVIPVGKFLQVPVIGTVKAGPNGIAYEEFLGFEFIDADMFKNCEQCFFLRVKGDSMEPEIKEGDLALIRRQADVESNSLAVVIVNGEEGMIKRIIKRPNAIVLQSINQKYEPIVITPGMEFRIVGKVISVLRKFE